MDHGCHMLRVLPNLKLIWWPSVNIKLRCYNNTESLPMDCLAFEHNNVMLRYMFSNLTQNLNSGIKEFQGSVYGTYAWSASLGPELQPGTMFVVILMPN